MYPEVAFNSLQFRMKRRTLRVRIIHLKRQSFLNSPALSIKQRMPRSCLSRREAATDMSALKTRGPTALAQSEEFEPTI